MVAIFIHSGRFSFIHLLARLRNSWPPSGTDWLSALCFCQSIFWLDHRTGNHYFVGVTYKEQDINSLDSLMTVPVSGKNTRMPVQLQDLVGSPEMTSSAVEVSHLALTRVVNIYANVEGRDVGAVAADIERVLSSWGTQGKTTEGVAKWSVPDPDNPDETLAGYSVNMRGEVASMKESFASLGFGMVLAVILIYLIMVAQFRSFLDPFIILFAVPLGLIGVLVMLTVTSTTLNVQSLMGVIFMVGIAVSNSILLVEFANRLRREHDYSTWDAVIESGRVRLRPILMTSLAAIVGLVPLALHEGEATMPLARAVIGGLSVSTALTIFVVPCLYVLFKSRKTAAPAAPA